MAERKKILAVLSILISLLPMLTSLQLDGYDEKEKSVTLYIDLPGVGKLENDDIKVVYLKNGLSIVVSNLNGKTHELNIPNLEGEIIPEQCKHKVKQDKMTVILKKVREGKWEDANKAKEAEKKEKEKEATRGSTPEVEKETDPSENLMDLMKKMYDEGDDDMKRTIAKAWTESREKQAAGANN